MDPLVDDPDVFKFSGTFLNVSISLCFSHLEGALGGRRANALGGGPRAPWEVAALPRWGEAQGCVLGGELGGSPGMCY